MNFLAHFFLSHQTPELVVGSFLGDFVKGKRHQQYEAAIGQGIRLHREIDRYTDMHPSFLQSKHRLSQQHGHYAGVIVDIFYDHLLAVHWTTYSPEPLPQFAQRIYAVLQQHVAQMPTPAQRVLHYMKAHDWLSNYTYPEGIAHTLSGLQQRTRFPNQMSEANDDLQKDLIDYTAEFQDFFPQVQHHVTNFLSNAY